MQPTEGDASQLFLSPPVEKVGGDQLQQLSVQEGSQQNNQSPSISARGQQPKTTTIVHLKDPSATNSLDKKSHHFVKRGDGIADFLLIKNQFGKCQHEVVDIERRVKSLEELFHKQSIIQQSNEIVTTASLQNYLDALTMHIEKRFQEQVQMHNASIHKLLQEQQREVQDLVKEKANKQWIERQLSHMNNIVSENSLKVDSIFMGLELSIQQKTASKAELTDLETLDKSKASVIDLKLMDERCDRLEKMINEMEKTLAEAQAQAEENSQEDDVLDEYDDEIEDLQNRGGGSQELPGEDSITQPSFEQHLDASPTNKSDEGLKSPSEVQMFKKDQQPQHLTPLGNKPYQMKKNDTIVEKSSSISSERLSTPLVNDHKSPPQQQQTFGTSAGKPSPILSKPGMHTTPKGVAVGVEKHHQQVEKRLSGQKVSMQEYPESPPPRIPTGQISSAWDAQQHHLAINNNGNKINNQLNSNQGSQPVTPNNQGSVNTAIGKTSSKQHPVRRTSTFANEVMGTGRVTITGGDRSPIDGYSVTSSQKKGSEYKRFGTQRTSILKNNLAGKVVNMQEIDTLKTELAEAIQQIKDLDDFVKSQQQPTIEFLNEHKPKLLDTFRSYDLFARRINEVETYDDQLKHKYLQTTLQHITDVKNKLNSEQNAFKLKQKQDYDKFLARLKVIETDTEYTKNTVDYLKKAMQQQKFGNNNNMLYLHTTLPTVALSTAGTVSTNPHAQVAGQNQQPDSLNVSPNQTFDNSQHHNAAGQQQLAQNSVDMNQSTRSHHQQNNGSLVIQPQQSQITGGQMISLPHQIVIMTQQISHLQKDMEDLKEHSKKKFIKFTYEIEDLKQPINDAVNDLRKENEAFMRETDRLDHMYKKVFMEYMDALDQNKGLLQRQEELEKRLNQSHYINNATIQFFGSNTLTTPISPTTRLSTPLSLKTPGAALVLDPTLTLDYNAFNLSQMNNTGHMWKRRKMETTPGRLDDLNLKVIVAKRKLNQMNKQEEAELEETVRPKQLGGTERARTSMAMQRNEMNEQVNRTSVAKKTHAPIWGQNQSAFKATKASSIHKQEESLTAASVKHRANSTARTPVMPFRSPQSPGLQGTRDSENFLNESLKTPSQRKAHANSQLRSELPSPKNNNQKIIAQEENDDQDYNSIDGKSHTQQNKRLNLKRFKNMF